MIDKLAGCGNCGGIIKDISTALQAGNWSFHKDAYDCANSTYDPSLTNKYKRYSKRQRTMMKNSQRLAVTRRYYEG